MSDFAKPLVGIDDARAFLEVHHGRPIANLEAFATGFWSAAFGYEVDGERLVVRFGRNREWYEVDQAAHAYDSDDVPVPRVREIGDAASSYWSRFSASTRSRASRSTSSRLKLSGAGGSGGCGTRSRRVL